MPSSSDQRAPAIVLDLDDTLYLERDYVRSGIAAAGEWVRRILGVDGFAEAASAMFADGRRERLFDAAFAMLGIDASPALIGRTVYEYRRHRPSIGLAPDAGDFLDRRAGASLALITDGWALAQRMKIAALGLGNRAIFPIVFTDDWGRSYWKPHLRAFAFVEAALGKDRDFVYIADNPAKDFLAPRMLGWRTVQIQRPERLHRREPPSPDHRADLTIVSLDQLDEAIGLLAEQREALPVD